MQIEYTKEVSEDVLCPGGVRIPKDLGNLKNP